MKEKFKNLLRNINPTMLIIILILLGRNMLNGGEHPGDWFYDKLVILPGIIIGLTFHEAAHGYASYLLGDPTPKLQGRLSLNPIKHIDPVGFIALLIAGFGWGIPVQIDPNYYKHKRRDEFIVSIAGVTVNFLIAVAFSFLLKFLAREVAASYSTIWEITFEIILYIISINIVLMIFNLLPVPPLDGFGMLTQVFDLRKYSWYYTLYQNGQFILMTMIIFSVTRIIISPIHEIILNWLLA